MWASSCRLARGGARAYPLGPFLLGACCECYNTRSASRVWEDSAPSVSRDRPSMPVDKPSAQHATTHAAYHLGNGVWRTGCWTGEMGRCCPVSSGDCLALGRHCRWVGFPRVGTDCASESPPGDSKPRGRCLAQRVRRGTTIARPSRMEMDWPHRRRVGFISLAIRRSAWARADSGRKSSSRAGDLSRA